MDLDKLNEIWRNDAPKLAAMEKNHPYSVPSGYFEKMADEIGSQVRIISLENNSNTFTLPENYFDLLSSSLNSRIKLEELKDVEVFSTPENYFMDLEDRINSQIKNVASDRPSPIIKKISRKWIVYAAAACITTVIGIGLYFNQNEQPTINTQLAQIPEEQIIDYLQLYSDAGDVSIIMEGLGNNPGLSELDSQLSEKEINEYLESNL